jgi:hypothetical protein
MVVSYSEVTYMVKIETQIRTDGEIKLLINENDERLVSEKLKMKIKNDLTNSCERFRERKTGISSAKLCLEFIADLVSCSIYGGLYFDQNIEEVKNIFNTAAKLLEVPKGNSLTVEQEHSAIKYLTDNLGLTASNKRAFVSDEKLVFLFLDYIKTSKTTDVYERISKETGLKVETIKKKINAKAKEWSYLSRVKNYTSAQWERIEESHNEIDLVDKIMMSNAKQKRLAHLVALRAETDEEIRLLSGGV